MSDIPIDAIADKLDEAADNENLWSMYESGYGRRGASELCDTKVRLFREMAALLRSGSDRLPAQDDPAERLPAKDEPVTSEADYVRSRGWRHG